MSTTDSAALSMKLLIDRKAQRVLFAEASKDVVDFLFSLLALPIATVVKLVGKEAMVGCVGNLYASVDKLDPTYVQAGAAKEAFLCPTVLSPAATTNSALLRLPVAPSLPMNLYLCTNDRDTCRTYITDEYRKRCPSCYYYSMTKMTNCVASAGSSSVLRTVTAQSSAKGFVQGIVTYTVMDNLTVTPQSAMSTITLLTNFSVRDIGDIQEKTVQLGYNEGLAILKASLQSKSVLTDVFIHANNE